ncbi:MAG TPA: two-component regulator propeller domain-containing protein [Ignavibacteria bacterium]|nr:two-component regulator propeller domain-containing protein [Ignavibacteria bacterium]
MLRITLYFLPLFIIQFASAPAYSQYKNQHVSLEQGLPAGTAVEAIVQDNLGFMWFPVLGGVAKYDGYSLSLHQKFFTATDTVYLPEVHAIFIDKENNIWLGSANMVALYDRKKDIFNAFYLTVEKSVNSIAVIYDIHEGKDGLLWISTEDKGLFSYDKKSKVTQHYFHDENNSNSLNSNEISSFTIDNEGNLWVGFYSDGLCKYEPSKNLYTRFHRSSSSNSIPSDSIHKLYKDSSGTIWIASRQGYITELNPQTNKFINYSIQGEGVNSSAVIYSLFEDTSGLIWIGTFREGVILFDKNKNLFYPLQKNINGKEKEINYVYSIAQDRTGLIWIGGMEGLHIISKNLQSFDYSYDNPFFMKNIKNAAITSILPDNAGNLWIGTSNGLYKHIYNSNDYQHFFSDNNPKRDSKLFGNNSILNLCFDDSGSIWVTLYSGLYNLNPLNGNVKSYIHSQSDTNSISESLETGLLKDKKGNLWISSPKSVDRFITSNETFKHYPLPTVRSFYEDNDGVIWASSGSRGLYKYDSSTDSFIEYFNESDFIGFSISLEDSKKRFWAASFYSGLNLFDIKSGKSEVFDTKYGLQSNFVNNLIMDNIGMLWLSTRTGISRFNPDTKFFKNFTEEDGLNIQDFQTTSANKSSDGKLYFGTRNGMVSFYPAPINTLVPEIVLTGLKLHNLPVIPSDTSAIKENINITSEINLNYYDNSFIISFSSLDYNDSKKNLYSYKLEGFDEDWSFPGTNTSASYTNLNAGEYTFLVKGSNSDGIWNENGAKIKVIVNPPWWKTWWFTVSWIFFAAIVFGSTIRLISVQKLKKKLRELKQQQVLEAERTRISKDMHDELGSSLTKITLLSEIAMKKIGNLEEINKISDASREVVNSMDEIVWAVNPKNDSLENLAAYTLQYSQNFLSEAGLNCRFEYPDSIPSSMLSSDIRHNIFLVFKEALNNVVKHSEASEVNIKLILNKTFFEFLISDNGKGFNMEDCDRFSNGLSNMEKRIADINGEFKIRTQSDLGTLISIKICHN